jgi:hypothetical protein
MIGDSGAARLDAGGPCVDGGYGFIECPSAGVTSVVVDAGDGDDWVSADVALPVQLIGGAGNDRLDAPDTGGNLAGGPGNDKLNGSDGADALDGGDGNDEVEGLAGPDQVYGGPGDDRLSGDTHKAPSPDVIDGGAGTDRIEHDWSDDGDGSLVLTLAGGADDGRPGEGDDIRNIEAVSSFTPGRYVGTEGPDRIELVQVEGASDLAGAGGDDFLTASDGTDRLDGGAGADTLDGGFGDDTIVGGPGPDQISGDHPNGECGLWYCKLPAGNDAIDARDGERDSVTCGVGADSVKADPVDTVAPDCEQVERRDGPGPKSRAGGRCVVPKLRGLRERKAKAKLKKAGCKAKVRRAASRRVTRGRVIKQSIRPGKRLERGATVKLTVSRTPLDRAAARASTPLPHPRGLAPCVATRASGSPAPRDVRRDDRLRRASPSLEKQASGSGTSRRSLRTTSGRL